jgi:hypothetical protein
MGWMEKVGGGWRPGFGGLAKVGGRPATYSLFSHFLLH